MSLRRKRLSCCKNSFKYCSSRPLFIPTVLIVKHANCPSCGAEVVFRSAASIFAVCEYCQSTLVRSDTDELRNLGKMAALVEDRSPLQLGAEGQWQGVHFAVIGRMQQRYSQGTWNEWYLLFDDMRTAWLSEAAGEYVLSEAKVVNDPLPTRDSLHIEGRVLLEQRPWAVTNIEEATCIAGAGELPFPVSGGDSATVVDLRYEKEFATLDYAHAVPDAPPVFYQGQVIDFAKLRWQNLREQYLPAAGIPKSKTKAKAVQCPHCAGALTLRDINTVRIGCPSCGSVLEVAENQALAIVSRALAAAKEGRYRPSIPLGTKGKFPGAAGKAGEERFEVIGYLVQETTIDHVQYHWFDYLLASCEEKKQDTYRWLVHSNGHWSLVDTLSQHPSLQKNGSEARHEGASYRHYATYQATVGQVCGEFTWRVAIGDQCEVTDFIAPPLMLSREIYWAEGKQPASAAAQALGVERQSPVAKEVTWSQGIYLTPEEVATAFKFKHRLPLPRLVAANQPNPWQDSHRRTCRWFWLFSLIALLGHGVLYFNAGQTFLRQHWEFTLPPAIPSYQPGSDHAAYGGNAAQAFLANSAAAATPTTQTSQSFTLTRKSNQLQVLNHTNLENNWAGLELTLVDSKTGLAYPTEREISYYHGVDEGESWSEGGRVDEVVFRDIPPGTYYLTADPEFPTENPMPFGDDLEIRRNPPGWSNLVFIELFLILFPIFSRFRYQAFESKRWAESDHAPEDNDDDDE